MIISKREVEVREFPNYATQLPNLIGTNANNNGAIVWELDSSGIINIYKQICNMKLFRVATLIDDRTWYKVFNLTSLYIFNFLIETTDEDRYEVLKRREAGATGRVWSEVVCNLL